MSSNDLSVSMTANLTAYHGYVNDLGGLVFDPHVIAALQDAGQVYVDLAKAQLEAGDPYPQIVSGNLRDSIKLKITKSGPTKYKVSLIASAPYARLLEYKSARRRIKPSLREIQRWWAAKARGKDPAAAGRIWRHIQQHGVKLHPFIHPAMKKGKAKFNQRLARNLRLEIIRRDARAKRRLSRALMRRKSTLFSFRSFLYQWAYVLGWMQALGIDVGPIRSSMYALSRGIGDASSVFGSRVGNRLFQRATGGMASKGLGASLPRVDPLADRAFRVSSGRLAGTELRGFGR